MYNRKEEIAMTVKEYYEAIGGSYDDVMSRLPMESMVERFLQKFKEDKSFDQLTEAVQQMDCDAIFKAVHTLKGVALNLGLARVSEASKNLTELVRGKEEKGDAVLAELQEEVKKAYETLAEDYRVTVEKLAEL
jgi:HPt (histidine-containing phosphotransfer) domain-containing protein